MNIQPRIKGFICTTAHPIGCAKDVQRQINLVREAGPIAGAPKRVLVLGASNGYGLASRIAAAFGGEAATLGVFFERPSMKGRPASAGWYKAAEFARAAKAAGLAAAHINGDAFSPDIKAKVIGQIKSSMGQVDLVVYSLAAPARTLPDGRLVRSAIKPIGEPFAGTTIDVVSGKLREIEVPPATEEETAATVQVMGGQDWQDWITQLAAAGVLAKGARTINYTYIGSEVTWPVYHHGTLGRAKADLSRAAEELADVLAPLSGEARVCVMKGLLTVASSAIPGLPLYFSLMFRIMKKLGTHEGCIEQINRLFRTQLYGGHELRLDESGRIRMDDWEMADEVQDYVRTYWARAKEGKLQDEADFAGYSQAFYELYGFAVEGVDYAIEVDPEVDIPDLLAYA